MAAGERRTQEAAIAALFPRPRTHYQRQPVRSGGRGVAPQQPRQGLLIDYEYCTGCHSCEVACKQEHDYPVGGAASTWWRYSTQKPDKTYRIDYIPFPTMYCDLCEARTSEGGRPPA